MQRMDILSDSKVVPFKVISNEKPADRGELPADMTPEQEAMYGSLALLGNFLLENRDNMEFFVAVAAIRDPEAGPDSQVASHIFTSPIKAADFALALKLLENSFFNHLNKSM